MLDWRRAVFVAIPLALAIGCGGASRVPVYPTRGSVTFKGKTPAGAYLVFHRVADTDDAGAGEKLPAPPRAVVADDGTFAVSTYEKSDGAPAGEYVVSIEWKPPILLDGGETGPGKNALPARYASPKSSGLKATVTAGPDNQLPAYQLTP